MKKIFLLMALCLTTVFSAKAQEVYAVWDKMSSNTLTLYYDSDREARGGVTNWMWQDEMTNTATKIVLSSSMLNARPTSTATWFRNFKVLKTISNLDYLNTSVTTDMSDMFHGCEALTSLNLTSLNTEKVENMQGMFYGCKSLQTLDISNLNTENVTNMKEMFAFCENLISINFGSLNTGNVTNMSEMFRSCKWLESLDLSSFNTQNVTDMENMFYCCERLTSINLSSFNTRNVFDMSNMFYGCKALPQIDVTMFDTRNVKKMGGMFYGCKALTTLNLSNFRIGNVYYMVDMFNGCSELTTIYCNLDWSASQKLSDSSSMFYGCAKLAGGNNTAYDSNYTDKTYARLDGLNGKKGYFTSTPKCVYTAFYESMGQLVYYYDSYINKRPTTITEPYDPDAERFGDYKNKITKVMIDASMQDAGLTSTKNMFANLKSLANIKDMENLNTEKVEDMSNMFYGCEALTSINLYSFNTAKVEDMSNMFSGCSALPKLDVHIFNVSKVANMNNMFLNCAALTTIYCNGDWSSYGASSTDMFKGCTLLVGYKSTAYDPSHVNGEYACRDGFNGKKGYFSARAMEMYTVYNDLSTTLTYYFDGLYESRTEVEFYDPENISAERFSGYNDKITVVKIDESLKTAILASTASMFFGGNPSLSLTSLTTIIGLENLNTENVTDMNGMFFGCSKLKTLDLTSLNIENVEDMSYMFNGCGALTTIYSNSDWSQHSVLNSENMFSGCTSLIGGNFTVFNSSHVDVSYAHPDEAGNPGYFSKKTTTDIDKITNYQSAITNKIIKDGQIFILRGEKVYTITGAEVR